MALLDAILSSSLIEVPLIVLFKTALVKVLFVSVCEIFTATKSCVPVSPLSGSLNEFPAAAECGCGSNV